MFTTRKRGRTAAVFGAVAGLLLTTATAANAAPIPTIDPDKEGSITITKLVEPDVVGAPAPGTQVTGHGGTPIQDVTFQLEKITGYDFDNDGSISPDDEEFELTTAVGWQNAAALTPAQAQNAQKALVNPAAPTNVSGELTFSGLPLGLYLVTEVSTSGAKINGALVSDTGDAVVPSSDPFLITVPMTDPGDRASWLYDVYVYPKNTTVGLEKSIKDGNEENLGDLVTYEVSMDIPEGTTSLTIWDVLDSRLQYVAGSVTFPSGVTGVVDYTDPTIDPDAAAPTLTVTFEAPSGQTLPPGEIGFTFEAKVTGVGVIPNGAAYEMTVSGVTVTGNSPEVLTKWGGYDVAKVDETGAWLQGAVFSLYEVRYDSQGNEVDVILIKADIESDENGKVEVNGLRYSLWANGAEITDNDGDRDLTDEEGYVSYRLVETKAPANYELQTAPFDFVVTGPLDRDGEDNIELIITNVPHNAGFELPAVGGNRAVLPILAAVIAAGGVVWLIRSRREQKA